MGIAHGVTGLHGGVTDGERAALDKVADVLGMPPEAGGLVSSMAGLESK
jgi:hypothetical protein